MSEYKIIEQHTRWEGTRYDVQIITAGRHFGWKEFSTREAAEAYVASRVSPNKAPHAGAESEGVAMTAQRYWVVSDTGLVVRSLDAHSEADALLRFGGDSDELHTPERGSAYLVTVYGRSFTARRAQATNLNEREGS